MVSRLRLLAGAAVMGAAVLTAAPAFAAATAIKAPAGGAAGVPAVTRQLVMKATAYGPSAQDNYPYGATDYFGKPLTAGDVAVDPSVIPLGTCLYVHGYQSANLPSGGYLAQADDEGGAIQGAHVDLFMNASSAAVSAFGVQQVQVQVLGPPTNPSASGTAACSGYHVGG